MYSKVFHEFNELPLEQYTSHTLLNLVAPSVLDKGLPPKNFIFVFDTSTSMKGEKLQQCKELMSKGMRLFRPCDKIALISYAENVTVEKDWTLCTEEGKQSLNESFLGLHAHGCTNISGALFRALTLASKQKDSTIVFLTDGRANRGLQELDPLETMVKKIMKDMNTRIHTVGVGSDHEINWLQKLCVEGTYSYVQNPEDLSAAFGRILGSAYSTVYQNFTVYLTGTNVNFMDYDGKAVTKMEVGDVYAEEQKDILIKVNFSDTGPYKMECKMRAMDIVNQGMYEHTISTEIKRGKDNEKHPKVLKRIKELEAVKVIHEADNKARKGDFTGAKQILKRFKTGNDPILSRAMESVEDSMSGEINYHTRGGSHVVSAIQREVSTQRGLSDLMTTPFQKKIERAVTEGVFKS